MRASLRGRLHRPAYVRWEGEDDAVAGEQLERVKNALEGSSALTCEVETLLVSYMIGRRSVTATRSVRVLFNKANVPCRGVNTGREVMNNMSTLGPLLSEVFCCWCCIISAASLFVDILQRRRNPLLGIKWYLAL